MIPMAAETIARFWSGAPHWFHECDYRKPHMVLMWLKQELFLVNVARIVEVDLLQARTRPARAPRG